VVLFFHFVLIYILLFIQIVYVSFVNFTMNSGKQWWESICLSFYVLKIWNIIDIIPSIWEISANVFFLSLQIWFSFVSLYFMWFYSSIILRDRESFLFVFILKIWNIIDITPSIWEIFANVPNFLSLKIWLIWLAFYIVAA
jgi:hypothetical protein